jgi:hypothetical protein
MPSRSSALEPVGVAVAVLAAAALFSFRVTYEPDLWWHLAQGRETVVHELVRTNVFSARYADYPQPYTPWLFDTLAYLLWTAGGPAALQAAQAAILALTFTLMYVAARRRAPAPAATAALLLAVLVIEARALPRPHLASFAGFACIALLVERATARGRARPLVWAVPAIALWSNLHVEAAFGAAAVALFAASECVWPSALGRREAVRALGVAAACCAATLANPYGVGLWEYLLENARVPSVVAVAELQPPYLPHYRAFFVFLAVAGVLLLTNLRALTLRESAITAAAAALGLAFLRLTPLVAIVAAPTVAARLGDLMARGVDGRAVIVGAAAVAIAAAPAPIAHLAGGWRVGGDALEPPAYFSRGAVVFAREAGLAGPVFNSNNLGGYVAWHLYPQARVFQDGRLQAAPPDLFRGIVAASASQDAWDRLVEDVDWAVLSRAQRHELSGAGRFPPGIWRTVYEDGAVQVLVRQPTGSPP